MRIQNYKDLTRLLSNLAPLDKKKHIRLYVYRMEGEEKKSVVHYVGEAMSSCIARDDFNTLKGLWGAWQQLDPQAKLKNYFFDLDDARWKQSQQPTAYMSTLMDSVVCPAATYRFLKAWGCYFTKYGLLQAMDKAEESVKAMLREEQKPSRLPMWRWWYRLVNELLDKERNIRWELTEKEVADVELQLQTATFIGVLAKNMALVELIADVVGKLPHPSQPKKGWNGWLSSSTPNQVQQFFAKGYDGKAFVDYASKDSAVYKYLYEEQKVRSKAPTKHQARENSRQLLGIKLGGQGEEADPHYSTTIVI